MNVDVKNFPLTIYTIYFDLKKIIMYLHIFLILNLHNFLGNSKNTLLFSFFKQINL